MANVPQRDHLVPVHVGLNLIFLVPGETGGMETYARELIPALRKERPDLRMTAFINREALEAGEGPWTELAEAVHVPIRARRRLEWVRGEQQLLPRLAARAGVDLLHSLGGTGPARGPFARVVTIHDVIYRTYPEAHFGLRSAGMRILVPLAARRSRRVIVPSQSTKADLIGLLRVPSERIDVVPMGVDPVSTLPADLAEIRRRYDLGDARIVLTASAKRPHKNLGRLLEAWALLPAERRPLLVLPGYPTQHEAELRGQADRLGIASATRFLGWIPTEDLEALYRLADCFVFPSLYEGFGFPVIEAMARGVPVACSGRAALAEVAGGAAQLFDPESAGAIAEALDEVLSNPELAERLRQAGREQARRFTWTDTARGTLEAYERTLEG
jgi:glycosyltransferase involved in cell wall biosynthesis